MYTFVDDLPSGLFWYHPHAHGATALQQGGGAFGPLLLESALDEVKLGLLPPLASDSVIVFSSFDPKLQAKTSKLTGDGAPMDAKLLETAEAVMVVNGEERPSALARAYQPHRVRLVNAAVKPAILLTVSVAGVDSTGIDGSPCNFFLTASDGTPLRSPRRLLLTPAEPLLMVPGNRRDIAFECLCEDCTVVWKSDGISSGTSAAMADWVGRGTDLDSSGALFTTELCNGRGDSRAGCEERTGLGLGLGLGGGRDVNPDEVQSLSHWLTEHSDWSAILSDRLFPAGGLAPPESAASYFNFVFNQGDRTMRGSEILPSYAVNNEPMPQDLSHVRVVQLGATEEWVVHNDHPSAAHPFHLHSNHFQLVASSSNVSHIDFVIGDWRDSVSIGPLQNITIRWKANDYTGSLMAHCHVTTHSDLGMGLALRIVDQ